LQSDAAPLENVSPQGGNGEGRSVRWLGGTLPHAWLTRFLEAVRADGTHLDWGEEVVGLSAILASAPPGEPLTLTNHDASNGQVPAVEAICHEIGLTYRRESAPHGEFDGEVVS